MQKAIWCTCAAQASKRVVNWLYYLDNEAGESHPSRFPTCRRTALPWLEHVMWCTRWHAEDVLSKKTRKVAQQLTIAHICATQPSPLRDEGRSPGGPRMGHRKRPGRALIRAWIDAHGNHQCWKSINTKAAAADSTAATPVTSGGDQPVGHWGSNNFFQLESVIASFVATLSTIRPATLSRPFRVKLSI